MAAELQHRTFNLLAVIQALANRTARRASSMTAFRRQFDGQLAALACAHRLLANSELEPITLGGLVRAVLGLCKPVVLQDRIVVDGPVIGLRKKSVEVLALALHDLAATACAHGALSTQHGRLTVTWHVHAPNGEGHRLVLDWFEDLLGPADEDASSRRDADRELVEKRLPYSLKGLGRYEASPSRLRCSLDLPYRGHAEEDGPALAQR